MQSSVTVSVSSACQSSIVNELDTMRVPGFRSRIFGRSFMLIDGSRNMVMTCAFEKSVSKRSALTNVALVGDTRRGGVLLRQLHHVRVVFDAHARVAPRLAAVMTVRPSPEPRSMTKSCGVTLAMSSILSTSGLRRRHPHDVFAGLAHLRFERLGRLLRGLRGRSRHSDERQTKNYQIAGQTCAHHASPRSRRVPTHPRRSQRL